MIKLRAPDGHTGMTIGGVPIRVEDGAVHVPVELVATLKSHGFSDWQAPAALDPVEEAVGLFRAHLRTLSPEDLRRDLAKWRNPAGYGFEPVPQPQPADDASAPIEPPPPGFDATRVRDEDIDALKRQELFAYLKHKGVQAVPPITGEKLREIAHRTARGQG